MARVDISPKKAVCPGCLGTGLFHGIGETKDRARPCWTCEGTGGVGWIYYEAYHGLREDENPAITHISVAGYLVTKEEWYKLNQTPRRK